MKKNFKDEKLMRAMIAFECKKVNDIAALLNITPQNLNGYIDRGTFINLIQEEALKRGININWIITGQGSMTSVASIGEQQHPYHPSTTAPAAPDISTIPHLPSVSIEQDLLSKTAAIIGSQTPFAYALKSNIEAFSRGLALEHDLAAYRAMLNSHTTTIEHQNKIIEEQNTRLNTFEERLRSMEDKKEG